MAISVNIRALILTVCAHCTLSLSSDAQTGTRLPYPPDSVLERSEQLLASGDVVSAKKIRQLLRPYTDTVYVPQFSAGMQEAYRLLAEAAVITSDHNDAFRFLKQHWKIKDSLLREEKDRRLNNLKKDYYITKGSKELIDGKIRILEQGKILKKRNFLITLIVLLICSVTVFSILYYQSNKRKISLLRRTLQQSDKEQRIRILEARAEAEEKERLYIANYLQNGLNRNIEVIRQEFMRQKKIHLDKEVRSGLEEIIQVLSSARDLLYQSAYNLNAEDFDLRQKLDAFIRYINRNLPVEVSVGYTEYSDGVSKEHELVIFRIVCELIQNIIKHADATHASIYIRFDKAETVVRVKDDGKGFDTGRPDDGMGLRNIRKIVEHYSGSVTISAGEGTEVILTFPNFIVDPVNVPDVLFKE